MVVVPLSKPENESAMTREAVESDPINWIGFAAGGTLVAAGLLLLVGERRAGMVAAASGTALAMLNEKETLLSWWNAMPGYIDQVQRVLNQVQATVEEVDAKREALHRVLAR
ncbi:MAG: hypothetical protein ABR990_13225 [Terracidiphilus sp.]|jgi:hypothetical protein